MGELELPTSSRAGVIYRGWFRSDDDALGGCGLASPTTISELVLVGGPSRTASPVTWGESNGSFIRIRLLPEILTTQIQAGLGLNAAIAIDLYLTRQPCLFFVADAC